MINWQTLISIQSNTHKRPSCAEPKWMQPPLLSMYLCLHWAVKEKIKHLKYVT
jgi:hypothetical protein